MADPGDDGDDGDEHPPDRRPPAAGPDPDPDRDPGSDPADDAPTDDADPAERSSPADAGDRTDDAGTDAQGPDDRPPGRSRDAPEGGSPPHRGDPPAPEPSEDDGSGGWLATAKEIGRTVATVAFVGLLLFAISGVWPPLVAVESGSMEPHMYKGDLVFIVDNGRFAPGNATEGVVTYRTGQNTGYWSFGNYGNVVVYTPHVEGFDGQYRVKSNTPIIHRARFYVEEGENWVAMANDSYLGGVDSCEEVSTCPADYGGFITKGDNNGVYDQVGTQSPTAVVKPEWIRGVAKVRIPWLGCVRLQLSDDSCF